MHDQPLEPGQRVVVVDEGGERQATFLRAGDPEEAIVADHDDAQRSLHRRHAAIVRFDEGGTRAVPYRDIRPVEPTEPA